MFVEVLTYPLAIVGISSIYALWRRIRLGRWDDPDRRLRQRVAYMLWVASQRS